MFFVCFFFANDIATFKDSIDVCVCFLSSGDLLFCVLGQQRGQCQEESRKTGGHVGDRRRGAMARVHGMGAQLQYQC